jgi:hypothetical protein
MASKKNVIIVSARRSGTHLLTDLVVNNFGYESINYNYIDYTGFTPEEFSEFETAMNEGSYSYKQPYVNHPKVTWTHAHDYKDYLKYKHSKETNTQLDRFFSESKIIIIYRDIRDIINSCYHRPRYKDNYSSFTDFYDNYDMDGYELIDQQYDNLSELLIQYYKNWFSVYMSKELLGLDIELISFKEVINEYEASVYKIGKFLEQPINTSLPVVDVRLKSISEKSKDIIYTDNDFRKGKVGDWVDTLGVRLGSELEEEQNIEINKGIDCFLNDIKIHKYHTPERNRFELGYKDWSSIEKEIDEELKQYDSRYKLDKSCQSIIENRYTNAIETATDFRYTHKVFYFEDNLLKFIYPCKASLDKNIFKHTVPVASKELLLTIFKTDKFLYENGITPKLFHAGVYKGVLYAIQEKYPMGDVISEKYKFHPIWGDWKWVVDLDLYVKLLRHFTVAFKNNILLTDIFNVYNCAIDNDGNVKYFDLDGIKQYTTHKEMINSEEFTNVMGTLKEIDNYHIKKFNYSLLKELIVI